MHCFEVLTPIAQLYVVVTTGDPVLLAAVTETPIARQRRAPALYPYPLRFTFSSSTFSARGRRFHLIRCSTCPSTMTRSARPWRACSRPCCSSRPRRRERCGALLSILHEGSNMLEHAQPCDVTIFPACRARALHVRARACSFHHRLPSPHCRLPSPSG